MAIAEKILSTTEVIFEKRNQSESYQVVRTPSGSHEMIHYEESHYSNGDPLLECIEHSHSLESLAKSLERHLNCKNSTTQSAIKDFLKWYWDNHSLEKLMNKLRNHTWRIRENVDSGTYVAEMAKVDPHGIHDWNYVDQGCTLYELFLNLENFDPNRRCTDSDQRSGYYDIIRMLKENIDELERPSDPNKPIIETKWFQLKAEANVSLVVYSKGRSSGKWSPQYARQSRREILDRMRTEVIGYNVSESNQRERAEDLMNFIQQFNQKYFNKYGVFETDYHYLKWVVAGGGFQLYSVGCDQTCKKYCHNAHEMITYLNNECRINRFSRGPEYRSYATLLHDLRSYLSQTRSTILKSKYYELDQHEDGTYILMACGYKEGNLYYQETIAPDLTGMLIKCRELTEKLNMLDARECEVRNDLVQLQKLIEDKIRDDGKSAEYDCYGSYNEEKCSGSSKCLICAYEHDCIKRSAELLAQKPKPTSKRTQESIDKMDSLTYSVAAAKAGLIPGAEVVESIDPITGNRQISVSVPAPAENIEIEVKYDKEDNTMTENRKSMMDRMVSQFYPQEIPAGQVGLTMNGQIAVRRGDGDYVRYNPATEAIENQMDFVLSGEQMDKMCILMPTAAAYLSAGDIIKEKQTYYQVIEISGNRIRSVNLNSSVTASLKIETNILTGQKMYQKVYSLFSMMQSSMMGGGMLGGMGMNPMMMAMVMDKFKSSEDKDDGEGSMADMLMPMMCMGMMNPSMMGMVPQNQQNAHEAQTPTAPAMGMNPMMNPMMMAMFMSKGSASDMMLPMMCMGMMGQGGQPMMAGNFCTPTTPVEEVAAESGELNNHSGENYGSTED